MFAALTDPVSSEYVNSVVDTFFALAPIVYIANQESEIVHIMAERMLILKDTLAVLGIHSLLDGTCSLDSKATKAKYWTCKILPEICDQFAKVADVDPTYDNLDQFPLYAEHDPAGSSVISFLHYG